MTGTAVVIGPVKSICYKGKVYNFPIDHKIGAGVLTKTLYDKLTDI